jgi:hypothetical protein
MRRVLLIVVSSLLAAAPAAHAAESSWATFAQGRQPLDSPRVTDEVAVGPIDVERSGGMLEVSHGLLRLQIAPRDRTRVRRGVYVNGANASVELRGSCGDPVEARAEVRDIAYGRDGKPTRLHVLFEHRCIDDVLVYGEARHNARGPAGATPSIVRWGSLDRGADGAAVPVTITAAAVAAAKTSGPFRIVEDACSGQAVAGCRILVAFNPPRPGTHRGRLTVTHTDGTTRAVPLQGFVYGGRTRFTLDGRTLAPPRAALTVVPAFGGFRVKAATRDGRLEASFEPADERRPLRRGSYTVSTRAGSPELEAGVDGLVCQPRSASFTITHLRTARNGAPLEFGARFRMRCENGTRTGSVGWRAGDRAPRAPWIDP